MQEIWSLRRRLGMRGMLADVRAFRCARGPTMAVTGWVPGLSGLRRPRRPEADRA